jgi:hypothetical protein
MGIGFFKVISVTHKIAFSRQKFRQSQRHGAPLLAKNLGNQHTAPANQELGKQEKGRLPKCGHLEVKTFLIASLIFAL